MRLRFTLNLYSTDSIEAEIADYLNSAQLRNKSEELRQLVKRGYRETIRDAEARSISASPRQPRQSQSAVIQTKKKESTISLQEPEIIHSVQTESMSKMDHEIVVDNCLQEQPIIHSAKTEVIPSKDQEAVPDVSATPSQQDDIVLSSDSLTISEVKRPSVPPSEPVSSSDDDRPKDPLAVLLGRLG